MTFKELAAQLSKLQGFTNTENQKLFSKLKDKPFWIWDDQEHQELFLNTKGNCCFNDLIGRPIKNGITCPLFDYEKLLYDSLFTVTNNNDIKNKHLYLLKATGIGATELFLRLMAWLCTRNDEFKGSQVVIVTGPNIDLAIGLIRRLKRLFQSKLAISFEDKETVLNLNGCHIQAYPSNHIDSFRSLDNPKFILLDESDMFRLYLYALTMIGIHSWFIQTVSYLSIATFTLLTLNIITFENCGQLGNMSQSQVERIWKMREYNI